MALYIRYTILNRAGDTAESPESQLRELTGDNAAIVFNPSTL